MRVAIIPARIGSKRIPKKNIKSFYGKPIIAWPIQKAIKSNLFDKVIVSTDSDEIADISSEYGAEILFKRPETLADDYAGTTEVISHATKKLLELGHKVSDICCIYATAAFVDNKDLKDGFELLNQKKYSYVFSVVEFNKSIYRAFKLLDNNGFEMLFPENYNLRSQDLEKIFCDAGQFYWANYKTWLKQEKIFTKKSKGIIIPNWRFHDIDNESDWIRAELYYKLLNFHN